MSNLKQQITELTSHINEINGMNAEQQNNVLKELLDALNSLYTVGNVNEKTINLALSVAVTRSKDTQDIKETIDATLEDMDIPLGFLQIISGIVWNSTITADERLNHIKLLLQSAARTK